tara:strand:- start:210 stop:749 length:540 start_codon:yes stop_codon:yes gene_type:complete
MENTPHFKILQKVTSLPSDLNIRILKEAFMAEHREKYKKVHKQLIKHIYYYMAKPPPIDEKWNNYFEKLSVCFYDDDIKTSNILFSCNCCKRHQRNKAIIKNDELSIITKNNYFISNFNWDGCYVYQGDGCDCACRNEGRLIARRWLKKKYGVEACQEQNRSWFLGMQPPKWLISQGII